MAGHRLCVCVGGGWLASGCVCVCVGGGGMAGLRLCVCVGGMVGLRPLWLACVCMP